jgi:hypothetical protein
MMEGYIPSIQENKSRHGSQENNLMKDKEGDTHTKSQLDHCIKFVEFCILIRSN